MMRSEDIYKVTELIDHEYRMCLYGKPANLMPYKITIKGQTCDYCIDSSGLTPLWPHEGLLSGEQVRKTLMAFAGAISDCREYLLDFDRVCLLEKGPYLKVDGSIGFAYKPFDVNSEEVLRVKVEGWLTRLHHHVDVADERVMAMLHPLSIAVAEAHFDLSTFEALILSTLEV